MKYKSLKLFCYVVIKRIKKFRYLSISGTETPIQNLLFDNYKLFKLFLTFNLKFKIISTLKKQKKK